MTQPSGYRGWIGLGAILIIASCSSLETAYFESKVNVATMEMVGKRYGAPHQEEQLADGKILWTYYDRGSATASYTGVAQGNYCRAYHLTFDNQSVLRDWKREDCAALRHTR